MPLDRLDAKLSWKIEAATNGAAPKVSVKVASASFANADAKGDLTATWRSGPGSGVGRGGRYPGQLELDGKLIDGVAARTARYLPLGLPQGVRSYVAGAVREGTIASATFRVRGDLWDFPFHDAEGGARRRLPHRRQGRGRDLRLRAGRAGVGRAQPRATPRESWPPFTSASGEIVVDRSTLDIRAARAQVGDVEWSGVQGRIAELGSRPRLDIEGTARGPLADMLRFVDVTPVGRWTGKALAAVTATGAAELKLALNVPLSRPAETVVKGSLALAGNDVRMTADTPLLAAAKGRVDFSQRGFVVSGASARALGGEIAFEGGSSAGLSGGDSQRFSGRGTVTAEALRQAPELGTIARLAQAASGQTSYRATLGFVAGRPQINVASNLVGLAIDLPAPLAKAAATPLSLRVRTGPEDGAVVPTDSAATFREALQVDLGGALQAHFLREVSGDAARVVRGAIRVAEARGERRPRRRADAARPDRGVAVAGERRRREREPEAARRRSVAGGARPRPGRRRARRRRRAARRPALPPRPAHHRWCSTPPAAPATFPTRSPCASASSSSTRAGSPTSPRASRSRPSSGAPTSAPTSSRATSNTGRRGAAPPVSAPGACSLAWLV